MKIIIDYISQFIPLETADAELLISCMCKRKYKSNEILYKEGIICKSILFLKSGTARSYFINSEGQEYTWKFNFNDKDATFINFFIMDYHSFLTQTPSYLSAEAIEDIEVIELSFNNLQKLLKQSPKMQEILRVFSEVAYSTTHIKAFDFLTKSAKDRYLKMLKDEPYLLNKFPQYYIASYLGIAPQSLSRLRKEISGK